MKYRIIEERDGNGRGHFELELWQKTWFKYHWCPVIVDYGWNVRRARKFSTRGECITYMLDNIKTRTTVEEGELA